jgi:hypothetical protein
MFMDIGDWVALGRKVMVLKIESWSERTLAGSGHDTAARIVNNVVENRVSSV